MWGHLSGALAIMLANFQEFRALSAMTAETSLCMIHNKRDSIGGLRITNDGLILVAVIINKYWADKTLLRPLY